MPGPGRKSPGAQSPRIQPQAGLVPWPAVGSAGPGPVVLEARQGLADLASGRMRGRGGGAAVFPERVRLPFLFRVRARTRTCGWTRHEDRNLLAALTASPCRCPCPCPCPCRCFYPLVLIALLLVS